MARPATHTVDVATPERILAAAAVEFAAAGPTRTRLEDIAARAGIRRPSLLYHFGSKDELYAEVVRRTFRELGLVLADAMERDAPFVARLEALARSFAAFLQEHPHHARIVVRELCEDGGPGQALLLAQVAPLLDAVVAFLETHGAALRPVPLRAAVMQVVADVLLHSAAGPVRAPLWGPTSPERTWTLARALLLAEES